MTEDRYRHLAGLAADDLSVLRPYVVEIGDRSGEERKAIYIAINRSGYACYAGQTRPDSAYKDAASKRIAQHLSASPSKREEWAGYWVIPLRDQVGVSVVNKLEREVCARLGLPVRNRRWLRRERDALRS